MEKELLNDLEMEDKNSDTGDTKATELEQARERVQEAPPEDAQTKKAEPEDAKKQPEQAGPPQNRSEISIIMLNGRVAVKAPANPILFMKMIGDALGIVSNEFLEMARKAEAKQMFDPGADVPYTQEGKQVIAAAQKELMGKRP